MKTSQVTEIISIVKKYLTCEKTNAVITLRVKDSDLPACKAEIEGVFK